MIPVLDPAALGGLLLLFANAFAAYATAVRPHHPVGQPGVGADPLLHVRATCIAGQENVGYALAAWMILIMLVTIGVYLVLRRRAERWQR